MTETHHLLPDLGGFVEHLHSCLKCHPVSVVYASVRDIGLSWVGYFVK